jgi:hypothetical protein
MIEDTTKRAPMLHLLGALSDGPSGYIEGMEAGGGRQLAASDLLPTDLSPADEGAWTALGFTLGDTVDGDPLFRHATLPEGWTRRSHQDPRGSDILDTRGIPRVSIFYKAAFYDRRASASIVNVGSVVANTAIYDDGDYMIPWDLLTADETATVVRVLDEYLADVADYPGTHGQRVPRVQALRSSAPST